MQRSLIDSSKQERFECRRFTILSNIGFLSANHSTSRPPVEVVTCPTWATLFVDIDIAALRAKALMQSGWDNLMVVEVTIPFF